MLQLCLALCNRMDYSLTGSFVHGISRHPATSTGSLASQRHPGKFPKVPGRRRGTRGFPAAPRQRPKGSQASCGVWIEDSGFLSRPCRKRRPSFHDDGGVSWVFYSAFFCVGFSLSLCPPMRWQDDALKYNQDIINTTGKSLLS